MQVLGAFQVNLITILAQLCMLPGIRIYVGNLYEIDNFPVPTAEVIGGFNATVAGVAQYVYGHFCGDRVKVADVHEAFS